MKFIEQKIREAMERGEFDNLSGKGEPVDLTEYFAAPEEVRVGHKLLKDANVIPEELELLKEIESLKAELKRAATETERRSLRKSIEERLLKYNLFKERYKRGR